MPHPNGIIKVKYKIINEKIEALINLPSGISGIFTWKDNIKTLTAGENIIKI